MRAAEMALGEACPKGQTVPVGHIGMKLAAGEVVKSRSGRLCSPFPEIRWGSTRQAVNTTRRVERWLLENAVQEARAVGNDLAERMFDCALGGRAIQQADKDCAETFLFA